MQVDRILARASQVNNGHLLRQDATTDIGDTITDVISEIGSDSESLSIEEQHKQALRDFHYFNKGFKGDELATNFTACGNRSAYWYFFELETIQVKLRYSTAKESTFNSTLFLQNSTDTINICTDTIENIYHFYLWKRKQFPTFSDVTLGFLQNLLANAMKLQSINAELTRLREETKTEGVDNSAREMYYIGVIVRMLIIFDPVAADLSRVSLPER